MAHGGARPDTGTKAKPREKRASKPKTKEEKNAAFDEKAMALLPVLFDTLVTIAKGYKVALSSRPRTLSSTEEVTEDGEKVWVYTVPPDKAAAMYLVDRASGKAAVKSAEQTETELILEFVMPAAEEEDDLTGTCSGGAGEWG